MPPTISMIASLLIACTLAGGCTSTPHTSSDEPAEPKAEIVALIDGQAITDRDLLEALHELGGDEILTEYVLDRALAQRCTQMGIEIGPEQIGQERLLLGETLGAVDEQAVSARVIETLRVRRGLGPHRYANLLRRNAMLRALVAPSAEPSQRAMAQAIDSAFGTKYRVRLFVSQRAEPASMLKARVEQLDPAARRWAFADTCTAQSIHPSNARGGLIESLSPVASGYPSAVLSALQSIEPGACSGVISTEAGFALVLLEETMPASTPTQTQRQQIIEQLGRNTQRIAMQRLAQQLLQEHEVIVLDRSLNWAWSNRP